MIESHLEVPAARPQLLATEHWGLLASRGSTQAEVLSRTSMFFTLISAGLVSIALVGQATSFDETFGLFSIVVLSFVALIGVLTHVRLVMTAMEDLMYVLAMNRLRGAYTAIDPGLAPYLMASPYDDRAGAGRTYDFLEIQGPLRHIIGSSFLYMATVEGAVVGLLAGAVVRGLGGVLGVSIGLGAVFAVIYFVVSMSLSNRGYRGFWRHYRPLAPTPVDAAPRKSGL